MINLLFFLRHAKQERQFIVMKFVLYKEATTHFRRQRGQEGKGVVFMMILSSIRNLVTLLRPQIKRITMIVSDRWLQTRDGQIHVLKDPEPIQIQPEEIQSSPKPLKI